MRSGNSAEPEYDDARRQRILEAAQRCFIRTGLHGTSMADIARESGLPEDVVEHHFATRDELVEGIAGNILRLVSGYFEEILAADPLPPLDEVIERFADTVMAFSGADGPGHLAPIFWASALYNEQMAERARAPITRARNGWIEIVERQRAAGALPPDADPRAVSAVLVCLLPGILLQRVLFDDIDPATLSSGARSLLGAVARTSGT